MGSRPADTSTARPMTANRRARRELERKLGDAVPDGRRVWDPTFAALYQLEPSWLTAVICTGCLYVGIVPSIPSKPLTWTCGSCGRRIELNPPGEVLEAIRPPGTLVLASRETGRRPALS